MIETVKTEKSTTANHTPLEAATPKLIAGAIFGLAFGFLLQKGGVGKYNVLIGQLLLQDWTVVKIILTAIVVGMIGVFTLHHFAKVNLHIKPTHIGANIIGGLLFGVGFALTGYCPGTAAVAHWDREVGTRFSALPDLSQARGYLPNFRDGQNERLRAGATWAKCCSTIC